MTDRPDPGTSGDRPTRDDEDGPDPESGRRRIRAFALALAVGGLLVGLALYGVFVSTGPACACTVTPQVRVIGEYDADDRTIVVEHDGSNHLGEGDGQVYVEYVDESGTERRHMWFDGVGRTP